MNLRTKLISYILAAGMATTYVGMARAEKDKLDSAGGSILKTALNPILTGMRIIAAGITGYDIVREKQGIPIIGAGDAAIRGIVDEVEYAVGIPGGLLGYETNELGTQGKVNEGLDSLGLAGNLARGAAVGGGLGSLVGEFGWGVGIGTASEAIDYAATSE